ncbi:hypothetical protein SEA_YEET_102 [Mycobacterium phage Yeet]|uniref:CDGP domain-containing protein n=2 Tax=Omegavirus baka TaxID=1034099 RepID=A0A3S9UAX0_9CAUD|nr:hypothetical protein N857_gp113 [Mycobacterium phage Wanda]YP_009124063.1 hypothetical protein VC71_gp110 [Mycobacterium phage Minerva]YP_009636282.1 hypothetical protein FGG20_gp111 [Mycobacterium phage Baka]ATN89823.1 hypothetical protein SEA_KLEIN_110 [Mycobacterium phage Klein]AZS07445.1 hypothetical protein PBI_DUKE13_106 [Mycobacterium phage Duke13]QCO93795.1 hypothetical protein SEA_SCHATZIE_105 [Mycobacterium phage Schatzie]QDM55686.1 hypothetical protein SEA_HOKKEND_100 [Mycobacte
MKQTLKAFIIAGAVAAGFTGLGLVTAQPAEAVPGQCGGAIVFGSGGGFCDGPPAPDGTWMHCESVYVMGFGGTNCFRVRPVPTTVDPRGWVPA